MDLSREEWRDIPGFEGLYQISIDTKEGRCRSLNFNRSGKVKELSNKPSKKVVEYFGGLRKLLGKLQGGLLLHSLNLLRMNTLKVQ